MADYIQSNILCQAYIRIENPKIRGERLPELRDDLTAFIERRSRFILYPEVSADVRFSAGSLIEHLTIAGSIYLAIQGYPKFREGVMTLFSDVKRLADSMILEAQFSSQAKSVDVARAEARTGVIGSLKALIDSLDNIKDSVGMVRVDVLTRRIISTLDDATRLLDVLNDSRDVKLIAENVREILFEFDLAPSDPKGVRASKGSLKKYRESLREFSEAMGKYATWAAMPAPNAGLLNF